MRLSWQSPAHKELLDDLRVSSLPCLWQSTPVRVSSISHRPPQTLACARSFTSMCSVPACPACRPVPIGWINLLRSRSMGSLTDQDVEIVPSRLERQDAHNLQHVPPPPMQTTGCNSTNGTSSNATSKGPSLTANEKAPNVPQRSTSQCT